MNVNKIDKINLGSFEIDKESTNPQFEIEMLLNHNISTKSLLQVESENLKGIVMVLKGKHQNWITSVEVVSVG